VILIIVIWDMATSVRLNRPGREVSRRPAPSPRRLPRERTGERVRVVRRRDQHEASRPRRALSTSGRGVSSRRRRFRTSRVLELHGWLSHPPTAGASGHRFHEGDLVPVCAPGRDGAHRWIQAVVAFDEVQYSVAAQRIQVRAAISMSSGHRCGWRPSRLLEQ